MRAVKIGLLLMQAFVLCSFNVNKTDVIIKEVNVKAPFEMPVIKIPEFSGCRKLMITDFGAVTGDKSRTSTAIAEAISEAGKIGGGTVVIPEGEWLTGQVRLKSNVNLYLSKGALLVFSDDPADYLPAVHSSWEGLECYNYSPLIYAYECKNVAITGPGGIKAKMDLWKQWSNRPPSHMESLKKLYNMSQENVPVEKRRMANDTARLRPQFIQFNRSENILLDGFSITNSPFWTIHLYRSRDIVVRNLKIKANGHNNDGLDPEMSQNILVENVIFDQGDDAIAIKSGRNPEGWRSQMPSRNLVVRNCTVKNGHQLIAIGSELSGGIENIFVDSCTVAADAKMFHMVFIKTNERMGGYVRNIYVQNVNGGRLEFGILGIETDVLYQWKNLVSTVERRLTPIQNVYLENLKASDVRFVSRILGQKELPVENVFLRNVTASTTRVGQRNVHKIVEKFRDEAD